MTPCIEWTGYRFKNGYGGKRVGKTIKLAHRLVWEEAHGPIPPGMCVLHHCDNRPCVNLDHLWLGTKAENNADRDAKGRHVGNGQKYWTHCKAGHEYTPENTYINKTSGQRVCRKCLARYQREYHARKAGITMSIVTVHGPYTWGAGTAETGPGNAQVNPANGLSWTFTADPSQRPAADYDWDFGANATPATQADSKGPISVTYSTPGTKTVTLTVPNAVATVTNKALTSNVATLTTSTPHLLQIGDSVTVAGVDATFNGTYTVTGIPTPTTFTYAKVNADVASASATGTVTWTGRPPAGVYVMGITAKTGAVG